MKYRKGEMKKSQLKFKNDKFGADYYKKKNINFDLIVSSIKEICENENPKNILDVGCGSGVYSKIFPSAEYTGVDISEDIIEYARSRGLKVIKCDIEDGLPFEDKTFDAALSMDVMEHTYDTLFHLKEIRRILEDDGFIILVTPNISSLASRIEVLKGGRPFEVDAMRSDLSDQDHISAFGIKDIYKLFDLAGFKIEILNGINAGNFTKRFFKHFPALSSSFLVKARPKNTNKPKK